MKKKLAGGSVLSEKSGRKSRSPYTNISLIDQIIPLATIQRGGGREGQAPQYVKREITISMAHQKVSACCAAYVY